MLITSASTHHVAPSCQTWPPLCARRGASIANAPSAHQFLSCWCLSALQTTIMPLVLFRSAQLSIHSFPPAKPLISFHDRGKLQNKGRKNVSKRFTSNRPSYNARTSTGKAIERRYETTGRGHHGQDMPVCPLHPFSTLAQVSARALAHIPPKQEARRTLPHRARRAARAP